MWCPYRAMQKKITITISKNSFLYWKKEGELQQRSNTKYITKLAHDCIFFRIRLNIENIAAVGKKMPPKKTNNARTATHYVWFSWFWSHLKMSKNIPMWLQDYLKDKNQRCLQFFRTEGAWSVPEGYPPFEKIANNIDFSLWGKQCIVPRKWDQNCENHT